VHRCETVEKGRRAVPRPAAGREWWPFKVTERGCAERCDALSSYARPFPVRHMLLRSDPGPNEQGTSLFGAVERRPGMLPEVVVEREAVVLIQAEPAGRSGKHFHDSVSSGLAAEKGMSGCIGINDPALTNRALTQEDAGRGGLPPLEKGMRGYSFHWPGGRIDIPFTRSNPQWEPREFPGRRDIIG